MARPCLLKVWTRVSCQPEGTGGLCRWQDSHCLCKKENGGCVGGSLWEYSPLPKDDFSSTALSQAFPEEPRDPGTLPGRLVPLNLLDGNCITYPPIQVSIHHPSIHLSTHPPIHPVTHSPTHSSIYPSIYPLTHPFIQFTIYSSIHLSIHLPHPPSIYPPTVSPTHTLIHQLRPFIHPVSCLIIFPSPLPPALPPTFPFLVVELCIQSCCPPPFLVTFELQHGTQESYLLYCSLQASWERSNTLDHSSLRLP